MSESFTAADRLRLDVIENGKVYMDTIKTISQKEQLNDAINRADSELAKVRDLHFRVGFAGAQSSGKSAVINGLLDYPIAPVCSLNTTCAVVDFIYGDAMQIRVIDGMTGTLAADLVIDRINGDCFNRLLDYACRICRVRPIENLLYFTDCNFLKGKVKITPDKMDMDPGDSRQITLLLLILFTVELPVAQLNATEKADMLERRSALYQEWNLDQQMNYRFEVCWNHPLLRSGMVMVDLPGLGSVNPIHDLIAAQAVATLDAMVFLIDKQIQPTGLDAVRKMLSKVDMTNRAMSSEIHIVPVINKCDITGSFEAARDALLALLREINLDIPEDNVLELQSMYAEYTYSGIPLKRKAYYRSYLKENYDDWEEMGEEKFNDRVNSKLSKRYEESNLSQLKTIFRNKLIERAQYIRSVQTVLVLRQLAASIVRRSRMLIDAAGLLQGITGNIYGQLMNQFREAVTVPLAGGIDDLENYTKREGEALHKKAMQKLQTDIPHAFVHTCDLCIRKYGHRLLAITGELEPTVLSFGSLARIDDAGSKNARTYGVLLDEIKTLSIDMKPIDMQYAELLDLIKRYIADVGRHASTCLIDAKKQIMDGIDRIIDGAVREQNAAAQLTSALDVEKIDRMNSAVIKLGDSLKNYAEQEISNARHSLDIIGDIIDQKAGEVVQEINRMVSEICTKITENNNKILSLAVESGVLFQSHKYIQLKPTAGETVLSGVYSVMSGLMSEFSEEDSSLYAKMAEGIMQAGLIPSFQSLSLPEADQKQLFDNTAATNENHIGLFISQWMKGAGEMMQKILTTAHDQIVKLIKTASAILPEMEGDLENQIAVLRHDIKLTEKATSCFRTAIESSIRDAAEQLEENADEVLTEFDKDDSPDQGKESIEDADHGQAEQQ